MLPEIVRQRAILGGAAKLVQRLVFFAFGRGDTAQGEVRAGVGRRGLERTPGGPFGSGKVSGLKIVQPPRAFRPKRGYPDFRG